MKPIVSRKLVISLALVSGACLMDAPDGVDDAASETEVGLVSEALVWPPYVPVQSREVSSITTGTIQVTAVKIYPSLNPASTTHWTVWRDSNNHVQLRYLGGEPVGRLLLVSFKVGATNVQA